MTTMRFQKYLSNRLNRSAAFCLMALTFGLVLYGCGENKVSQCTKIVTVANKAKSLAVPKDSSGFVQLSESIDQIRGEVQAIAIQDSKLKEQQIQLLGMYADISQSLKTQVKAIEAKDKSAVDKAKQDLGAAASKESDIVDRLNALCTK